MGKQSKRTRDRKKIHVKVRREHITAANERLRLRYNERFTATIPTAGEPRLADIREMDQETLVTHLEETIDFYKAEIIPPDRLKGNTGKVDPEDVAYNTLCDKGVKAVLNHAHENGVTGDDMNRLTMRSLFGLQLKKDTSEKEGIGDLMNLMDSTNPTNPANVPDHAPMIRTELENSIAGFFCLIH